MYSLKISKVSFKAPLADWLLTALFIMFLPAIAFASEEEGGLYIQTQNSEDKLWTAAPQLSTSADMVINGLVNRVKVEQRFTNPTDDWINARYLFPLPQNAAVDHLTIQIGERIIEGEIQKKQQARETFNRAAEQGKKASLVEQHRANLFSTQIANVAPGETIVVNIQYQETVLYEDGEFSLRFPTTFTHRYIPGLPDSTALQARGDTEAPVAEEGEQHVEEVVTPLQEMQNGWAVATRQVPDANEITPEYRDPLLEDEIAFTLEADINMGLPIDFIESTTASINVEKVSESRYSVTLSEMEIANQDFVLKWRPAAASMPVAALFVQEKEGEKYGLLMAMPPQSKQANSIPQNITLVLDISGSMYGESIEQAKEAVIYALHCLEANDYFNLIIFNHEARRYSSVPVKATLQNIGLVSSIVRGIEADGGTEMATALELAYASEPMTGYLNQIVFMTDGAIGNEDELYSLISKGLKDRRLFTVGIGSAPNSAFMQRAAVSGKGSFTHISNLNEVSTSLKPLFEKLSSPVMKDITVKWDNGEPVDAWPNPVPDLYKTQPLDLAFTIPENASTLQLTGIQSDAPWQLDIDLEAIQAGAATGIDVLWARKQIESITLNQSLSADEKETRITELGLNHHIVTKHTSLVAVDNNPSRPLDEKVKPHQINPHAPKNNVAMLHSGLGSTFMMLLGGLMLAVSAVGIRFSRASRDVFQ